MIKKKCMVYFFLNSFCIHFIMQVGISTYNLVQLLKNLKVID